MLILATIPAGKRPSGCRCYGSSSVIIGGVEINVDEKVDMQREQNCNDLNWMTTIRMERFEELDDHKIILSFFYSLNGNQIMLISTAVNYCSTHSVGKHISRNLRSGTQINIV